MKKIFLIIVLFSINNLFAQTSEWKFDDAHCNIQFTATHMVISQVTGHFRKFDGQVTSVGDDFTKGKINFTVDVASITTDNETRDNHLKSDDFFNAAKYPKIKFMGKSLKKTGDNKYKLYGDFTIRDITKPIMLDVTYGGMVKDPEGNIRAGFKIIGKINRFDYNLKWNFLTEAGGLAVGKEVEILCNVELIKQK